MFFYNGLTNSCACLKGFPWFIMLELEPTNLCEQFPHLHWLQLILLVHKQIQFHLEWNFFCIVDTRVLMHVLFPLPASPHTVSLRTFWGLTISPEQYIRTALRILASGPFWSIVKSSILYSEQSFLRGILNPSATCSIFGNYSLSKFDTWAFVISSCKIDSRLW
jgi:hypothetical protein